jgi:hypothetical protein
MPDLASLDTLPLQLQIQGIGKINRELAPRRDAPCRDAENRTLGASVQEYRAAARRSALERLLK